MAEASAASGPVETPMPVWIEDSAGTIVRGVAESVSTGGARVRLTAPPTFGQGAGVALRICVDPKRPIVAATAQVSWVRSNGGGAECGLVWTSLQGPLGEWLASRN